MCVVGGELDVVEGACSSGWWLKVRKRLTQRFPRVALFTENMILVFIGLQVGSRVIRSVRMSDIYFHEPWTCALTSHYWVWRLAA